MNEIKKYNEIVFEDIKHIDEYGNESLKELEKEKHYQEKIEMK